jgi:diguanylate cyclase (GGDEF)-like protein
MKIKVSQQAILSGADSTALFAFPGSVDKKGMTRRRIYLSVGGLLAVHGAAIFLSRQSAAISALFIFACSVSAAAACFHRSTQTYGPVRRKWDFLASALSLWSIGQAIHAFRLLTPNLNHESAIGPDFYFLVYGIPVLLAISTSNEERDTVLFVLIDSFQAIFAVVLVYIELSLAKLAPVPATGPSDLTLIYGIGCWILAGAASLRRLARPRGEERALYRILLVYLFLFAILATPFRGTSVFNALPIGLYRDLLSDLVFLMLTAGCLLVYPDPEPERMPVETNSFALVLNNGSPILFTLAVLALGAMVARQNFTLGISTIGLSLLIYCFRAALLQSAYMNAQHALTRSQYALREANSRLKQLSLHDALTGLPNRRLFDQTLDLEWNRALRNRRPLSLLILDVDCFKALNDLRGHPAGDESLRRIALALQGSLRRAGEIAARYGGEEFAAILPDSDLSGAISVAEAMRAAILSLEIPHEGSTAGKFVSVSIGAATMLPDAANSAASLIAAADEALYRAKRNGRNRVESLIGTGAEIESTQV